MITQTNLTQHKIGEYLLQEYSLSHIYALVNHIGTNKPWFEELMKCYLAGNTKLAQRAAWAVDHCCRKYPELAPPHYYTFLKVLQTPNLHDGIKRCASVVFLHAQNLPEDVLGNIVDVSFQIINNPQESIAVRANMLGVLTKMLPLFPELKHEFLTSLDIIAENPTPALMSRIKKARKAILKL